MVTLEHVVDAVLAGDSLAVRSLVQDFLASHPILTTVPRPSLADGQPMAVAAALTELFSERRRQAPPTWTRTVGPAPEALYLVRSAITMPRLRQLCEDAGPEPLRRRRLYAPPDYLVFA